MSSLDHSPPIQQDRQTIFIFSWSIGVELRPLSTDATGQANNFYFSPGASASIIDHSPPIQQDRQTIFIFSWSIGVELRPLSTDATG